MLPQLALDDDAGPLEEADGARVAGGIGGFNDELGRRTAVPAAKQTAAPTTEFGSSTAEERALAA